MIRKAEVLSQWDVTLPEHSLSQTYNTSKNVRPRYDRLRTNERNTDDKVGGGDPTCIPEKTALKGKKNHMPPPTARKHKPKRMRLGGNTPRHIPAKPEYLADAINRSWALKRTPQAFWTWKKGREVIETHLRTHSTIHTSALHQEPEDQWFSTDTRDLELGAWTGSITKYLSNRYTWANITTEINSIATIEAALNAAEISTLPMRMTITTAGWPSIETAMHKHKGYKVRAYKIAQVRVNNRDIQPQLPKMPSESPPTITDAHIYVIENNIASDYSNTNLRADLASLGNSQHLVYQGKPSGCTWTGIATRNTKRTSTIMSPATFWLREYPTAIPNQQTDEDYRPGTTSRILGMMGILPRGPESFYKRVGFSPLERIQTESLKKIKAILRRMAWELYTRRKKWAEQLG